MKLIAEIIEIATDGKTEISVLLRKCLVLSYQLKNERLKDWVDKELNGYSLDEEVPKYRQATAVAKGFFVGPLGSAIKDQPLAPSVLKKEHRHFAETAKLRQPIVAYDSKDDDSAKKDLRPIIHWPPDLTVMYQTEFYDGYVLNRAWQEIPNSVFAALIDTVRNRVLRFALDLQEELGLVSDDPAALPPGKVDQYVNNYIFGGTNIIAAAAQDFTQVGSVTIAKGDFNSLAGALKRIGISDGDVERLKDALAADDVEEGGKPPSLGRRAMHWVGDVGTKLAGAGARFGADEAAKLIGQYLGIS